MDHPRRLESHDITMGCDSHSASRLHCFRVNEHLPLLLDDAAIQQMAPPEDWDQEMLYNQEPPFCLNIAALHQEQLPIFLGRLQFSVQGQLDDAAIQQPAPPEDWDKEILYCQEPAFCLHIDALRQEQKPRCSRRLQFS